MSRKKTKNCNHAYYRAFERCGWDTAKTNEMIKKALKYGVSPYNYRGDDEIRELFIYRQLKTRRRIKIFAGYVFVFASTSTRCYIIYPLEK